VAVVASRGKRRQLGFLTRLGKTKIRKRSKREPRDRPGLAVDGGVLAHALVGVILWLGLSTGHNKQVPSPAAMHDRATRSLASSSTKSTQRNGNLSIVSMASQISDQGLGEAFLQSVQRGSFPQSEDVASASVSSDALPKLLEAVGKAREDTKVRMLPSIITVG
jgi:hypothetical protein